MCLMYCEIGEGGMATLRDCFVRGAAAAALALTAQGCLAWGAEGHRMVGLIADQELTLRTRMAVRSLMGADSLADVANWMDEIRPTTEGRAMATWHYVNIDVCHPERVPCPDGQCVIQQISAARDSLRKAPAGPEALRSLKILVHLIGDVHQPLHAGDNGDRGGNDVLISNRRCKAFGSAQSGSCKLHAYWDSNLVKSIARGASEETVAQALEAIPGTLPLNDSDNPQDWALQSEQLARSVAYNVPGFACGSSSTIELDAGYDQAAKQTVRLQLARAGHRLARILNSAFDRR